MVEYLRFHVGDLLPLVLLLYNTMHVYPYHHHDPSAPHGHAWPPVLWSQVTATPPDGGIIPIGNLFEEVTTLWRIVWRSALRTEQLGPVLHSAACVSGYEREQ